MESYDALKAQKDRIIAEETVTTFRNDLGRQRELWFAINEYTASCGGDTSTTTISDRRMAAVAMVERAVAFIRDAGDAEEQANIRAGAAAIEVYKRRIAELESKLERPFQDAMSEGEA